MATSDLNCAVFVYPSRSHNSGEPDKGASRIPCPPPVAIGPSSPLPGTLPACSYAAGLDKLFVSFWLKGEGFDEFRRRLQEFKEEFNDDRLCGPDVSERAFDLGFEGISFNMTRTGARKYSYKLKSGDIVLLFSNHKFTAPHPNCQLEIHSMSCWNPGWKNVFDRFLALLDQLGCTVHKHSVTESHITADLFGVDFTKTSLINPLRWIVKAPKDISQHHEFYKPSYISFGKGNMMFRCYDKTAELKHDSIKRYFFWNFWFDRAGYVPEHVTRFEFQMRRAVLKELGINTVDDLEDGLDMIWQYCVGLPDYEKKKDAKENGWARFCSKVISEKDRKNKHQSRYKTAFLWNFLVRSVRFGGSRTEPVERIKLQPQIDRDHRLKQAAGCLLSVCAIDGMHPDDLDGHITHSINMIASSLTEKYKQDRAEYVRRIETKHNQANISLFKEFYNDNPYNVGDCFIKDYKHDPHFFRGEMNVGDCFLKDAENYSHERALGLKS